MLLLQSTMHALDTCREPDRK